MPNPLAHAVLWGLSTRASETPEAPASRFSVFVFDYAGVLADVLEGAVRESHRIVASAGVDLVWVDSPMVPERLALDESCREAHGLLVLVLHIPSCGIAWREKHPNSFGLAVAAENGGFGAYACVFHDGIMELDSVLSKATVLGHSIVHEPGHLLLGPGGHSRCGIMTAIWNPKTLEQIACGEFVCDGKQKRLIQENVNLRPSGQNRWETP